ncbi:MAG: glycosyltransferase family 39 protein [Nakamurella sp.]
MAFDARTKEHNRGYLGASTAGDDDDPNLLDFERSPLSDLFTEPSLTIDPGDPSYQTDPAALIVPVGATPTITPPVKPHRRLMPPMPTDVARGWIVTAALTLIGGIVRFWELGWRTDGGTPLFDEKYYAVQAAEMLRTGGVEDNQAFGVIVHPPLGKQLISLGETLFHYTPTGWRFASAIAGTVAIFLIIRAVRRLTRSTMLGGIAGILLICDGVSQVMSHTALLDTIITPFVLAAFACLLADRDLVRRRFAAATADGSMLSFVGGVPLGARWWRFGAGFLLGCATAVKWNGAYWIIGFGLMSVIWDISARRQFGLRHPVSAVVRRDLLPSLWSLGLVPVLTYVGSYWAWFANDTGWDRHVTAGGNGVIGALKSLVTMTLAMLQTTEGILTPTDPALRHPWESKPWSWPLATRPVLYYLAGGQGTTGCGEGQTDCVKRILLVGTPMLWWVSLFVLGWALWKVCGRLDWRYAAVLVAYGAGYLPWFTIFDRQMYFFYMTPVAPFLVIGITLVLGDILGRAAPARAKPSRRHVAVASARWGDEANSVYADEYDVSLADSPTAPVGLLDADTSEPDHDPDPDQDQDQDQDADNDSNVDFGSQPGADPSPDLDARSAPDASPRPPKKAVLRRAWTRMRSWDGRTVRLAIVCAYIGLVAANFIAMWPILMGDPITPEHLRWLTWLPSWG